MGFLDGSGVARLWEHIIAKIGNKVDKETGKGLSTNDYTTTEKNKLAGIAEGANKTIVDSALSSTSTDPVQNKVVNAAINDLNTLVGDTSVSSQINTAVAGKADLKHTHSLSDIEETYSSVQRVSIVPEQTSASEISSIHGRNLNVYVGYKAVLEIDNKRYQGIIEKTTVEGAQAVLTSSTSSITYTIESPTFTDDTINFSPPTPSGITLSLTVYKDVATINEKNIDSNIARVNDVKTLVKQKVDKESGKGLSTNDFTTAEKNKLAGIAENANNYTLPVASSTLGGVKTTSTVTSTTGLTATPIINGVPYYKDTNTTYNNGTGISISNNKINHSNSVTAKTAYGSTATSASANGGSFTVTDIKYDAQGHITGSTDRTINLSQTTYTLSGLGGVPTSRKVNGHALTADIALTATDVGAVSPEDLQAEGYITGISGSDVIDALGYTPVNQANLGDFTGASATQAGDTGLVPAPSAGDQSKFLRGDGTWATVSTSGGITGDYLPLTGGTLTGNLTVDGTISVGTSTRATTAENILADKNGVISNANACLTVGVYATNTSTTNLPFSTYGTLTVYKSAQNWIIQIWTSSTSTESSMYMRKNINGEGFGSWHKLLGSDSPVSIAQGGTGGTKLEEAQKNILDGTYPAEGTDLSKFAPGIYCLPNDSNTIANVPAVSWSPMAFVFGHQNNDTAADGSPTGAYFQGYLDWEGELWLRRRKWDGWGNWLQIMSSNGGEINGGTLTVSKTSGFNYSGIEEGTTDAFRNVWFSDTGAKGKPCYHSGLLYNPGTRDLAVDGHSVYHTGNIIYSSTQPSNASTGTIWLKPV